MPKKIETNQPASKSDALREILADSDFHMSQLESGIGELEQDIDETDPYWLEGAMESVAGALWHLVAPDDRANFATAKLSKILDYLADNYGVGLEASAHASQLEGANSSSWYDDEDIEELESSRDRLFEALMELADELKKASA